MTVTVIADLVHEAQSVGASFEVTGDGIVVSGVTAIPPAVRDALKSRRDELRVYLCDASDAPPSSSARLSRAGIDVVYIEDEGAATTALAQILTDVGEGPIGLDIETTPKLKDVNYNEIQLTKNGVHVTSGKKQRDKIGLDPLRSDVRLIQIYGGGRRCAVFDMHKVTWASLVALWDHPLVVHNVQFELGFLHTLDLFPSRFECTMQAAGLMLGVHRRSLHAAALEYLGWDIPKELQTSDWGAAALSSEQIAYAALDAVVALRLWQKLEPDLRRRGRWDAYELQRDAIPAAVEMERSGIGVDLPALNEQIIGWEINLSEAREDWRNKTDTPPPEKLQEIQNWLAFNLTPDELAAWPRTSKTGQLSTSASDLERAAHLPAIRPLLEIKRLEKLLSSFEPSLRNAVHPATHRIHASYLVAGAKSGRWSCRSPNLQQMPGERLAPGFRAIFKAPEGRVLIGADYSQMEMRAAAEVSGDMALRQVFVEGRDLHETTAAEIAHVPLEEVTKEQRSGAKPVNFGSIYGMGAAGLAATAWNSYRIEMTQAEAAHALKAIFRKFSRLHTWMHDHAETGQQRHYIRIGAGRVVEDAWEPKGIRYTQCCNLPVQGACADVMMRAVSGVYRRLRTGKFDAIMIAQIHDELILEANPQDAEAVSALLIAEMTTAFCATFPDAPTINLVDVSVGRSWADLK
jgi:DNA polymerase I-like protein with 3'-5' exonuclease and polymerase domains